MFHPNRKPWGIKGANEVSTHCQPIIFRLLLYFCQTRHCGCQPQSNCLQTHSGQPSAAHPTAGGGGGGGEVEVQITVVTNTFAPTNTHTLACKKLLETFIFLKGRTKINKVPAWPAGGAGWGGMGGWALWETDGKLPGTRAAIVFTTKSASQLEAIHVPTTLHQAFSHPTCQMTVPSGCWAQEQKGASTQPENLWFRFTLHPSGIPHHDSCCGLSRQGSSCFYFWFWTFCHQASKNSSAAIYIHIVSGFLFCLAQASF